MSHASLGSRKRMGRTANSLERAGHPLEAQPRPSGRAHPHISHRGFAKANARTHLSLPAHAGGDRATRDLPRWPNLNDLELAPLTSAIAHRLVELQAIALSP